MRAAPRLCECNPGICLTTEEKAQKTLSQGSRRRRTTDSSEMLIYAYQNTRHHIPKLAVSIFITMKSSCLYVLKIKLCSFQFWTEDGQFWSGCWWSIRDLNVHKSVAHCVSVWRPFKAHWLLHVPPILILKNCAFFLQNLFKRFICLSEKNTDLFPEQHYPVCFCN